MLGPASGLGGCRGERAMEEVKEVEKVGAGCSGPDC